MYVLEGMVEQEQEKSSQLADIKNRLAFKWEY